MLIYTITSLAVLFASSYAAGLTVTIVPVQGRKATTQQLAVHYTNTNPTPVAIYKWFAPQTDELDDPAFDVLCQGKPVPYIGRLVKRRTPTAADMITIEPKRTVSSTITLSKLYDMSKTCQYEIRYTVPTSRLMGVSSNSQTLSKTGSDTVDSNAVSIFFAGQSNKIYEEKKTPLGKQSVSFVGCSSAQQASATSGLSAAVNYAYQSAYWLYYPPASKARFTTWFGPWSSSSLNTVYQHFSKIYDVVLNQPITFDCTSVNDPKYANTYAYVYANTPYRIYLCVSYFSAPVTGYNSKGGTIIHETSHFTVVAGTKDNGYGAATCKNLAITNPSAAIANGDSHEYFAENANPQL